MKQGYQVLVLLLIVPVVWFLVSDVVFTADTEPLKPADIIVVLGNPANADGSIGLTQKSRVQAGINLYKKGLAATILFTGGPAVNQFAEAEVMKQYALSKNVPPQAILTESQSINTLQNAFYSNAIIQNQPTAADSLIIVSSAYHTLRARYVFKPYGYHIQTKATSYPKKIGFKGRLKAMFYEYAAWLYYTVYGWEFKNEQPNHYKKLYFTF